MKGTKGKRFSLVRASLQVVGLCTLFALALLPREFVSNPSPMVLVTLVPFLPGVWFLARFIVSRCSLQRDAMGITPGLALALWILSVHISGLLLHNFHWGMAIGTVPFGVLGYMTLGKSGCSRARAYAHPPSLWWSAVIGTLILLPTVVLKDNWDKLSIITGHFSITEQIVNGIYPPRHLTFAHVVLPYHYGVDTLFAMVRVVFRLRFDVAIDLVTTVLFFYTILLYGHIGTRFFGKKVGPFAGFLGAFASGFPSTFGFNDMPPSVISNWFQQPWTLGIPMFLTLFLILTNIEAEKKVTPLSLLAVMVVTIVLGMAQTALYGIFLIAMLGWAAIAWLFAMVRHTGRKTLERPYYLIDVAYAVIAGALVAFFVATTSSLMLGAVSGSVVPRSGLLAGNWSRTIMWNLQCFSIPLLFGSVGMIRAGKMYMPSLIMAFGAMFVFNRYTYIYSWDITKFTQVAWIPLAIFAAGYIAHLLTHGRYYVRVAAILPAVSLVWASMVFLRQFSTDGFHAWKIGANIGEHTALWMEFPRKNIPQNFISALTWVRQRVSAGEITLLPSEERTFDAAVLAGLPVLLPGWGDHSLQFSSKDIDRRTRMHENIAAAAHREYTNEGVRWVVFSSESNLAPQINEWLSQEVIRQVAAFGDTVVYEFAAFRADG